MNPNIKEEIMLSAQKLLHFNNLLIRQCDSWLPEEEGNRYMMRKIMDRENKPYPGDMQVNPYGTGMTAQEISRQMIAEREKKSIIDKMVDWIYSSKNALMRRGMTCLRK